jgi:hypothetical protein
MLRVNHPFPSIIAITLCLALAPGCDSSDLQRQFEADAFRSPAGITRTDQDGNVIGDPDPDDWRSSPLFPSVTVQPAFPNPVPAGFTSPVTVEVSVPFTNVVAGGLVLLVYDPRQPGRFAALLDRLPPEAIFTINSLRFTRGDLQVALNLADPSGLYRLFVQDGSGRLVSYGDVRLE